MNPIRTFSRRLAAVLAAVALVSAAARPVLACEMGQKGHMGHGASAAASAALAEHAGHQAHAAHATHALPTDSAPDTAAPGGQAPHEPASQVPVCDHLIGCAVMIVSAAPAIAVVPVAVPEAAVRAIDAAIDAPTIPLETPPPRA